MTVAMTNPLSALTGGANPLAGIIGGRVKPLDPNELVAVATEIATQQEAAAAENQRAANLQQLNALEQQQAQLIAQHEQVAAAEAEQAAQVAPTLTGAPQTQQQEATTATTDTSTGAVAIPTSAAAPRTTYDYWTSHIAQFAGKYLPDGPEMLPNCGPASVTMALRMIGLDIPGYSGQNSSSVLETARILATGKNDTSVGTTDDELQTLINKSGANWSESNNFDEMLGWVKQGIPVVLSGNPHYGWNHRYSKDQVEPFDGGHWVTVSGYDATTGYYIVNDPLSQIGPIFVSEAELRGYNQAHGNLGIAVFR